MSDGEMLYLAFVLAAFASFAAVLAVVSMIASGDPKR